jgi:hypothetical protein
MSNPSDKACKTNQDKMFCLIGWLGDSMISNVEMIQDWKYKTINSKSCSYFNKGSRRQVRREQQIWTNSLKSQTLLRRERLWTSTTSSKPPKLWCLISAISCIRALAPQKSQAKTWRPDNMQLLCLHLRLLRSPTWRHNTF